MSPNWSETDVCGSSIFVGWLAMGEAITGCQLSRASFVPPCQLRHHAIRTGVVGRLGIISSDFPFNLLPRSGQLQKQLPPFNNASVVTTVASLVCFCWNHKCLTCGGYRISQSSNHQNATISTPHWWAPIRAKQLSLALPSLLDDWLPTHEMRLRAPPPCQLRHQYWCSW